MTQNTVGLTPKQHQDLLHNLLALLPKGGKVNTPKEADAMQAKMNQLIDKAFQSIKSATLICTRCGDSGYLHAFFQLRPGVRVKGDKTTSERIPNSPKWFLKLNSPDPSPDLELTRCIVRCTCNIGQTKPKAQPSLDSFS